MHASSLISCLVLAASVANAAPVFRFKRLDDLTENVNGVNGSTPVTRTCKLEDKGDKIDKNCGALSVAGLTTEVQLVALQIACLNDEAQCLKDDKATAECKSKREKCEIENRTGSQGEIRMNEDGNFRDIKSNFFQSGTPACAGLEKLEGQDKPFICDQSEVNDRIESVNIELRFKGTPVATPSKFIEDNDAGHTLIGEKLKKGPYGEGIKTLVMDNGDSTFTAGNLTTYSRSLALQLGCLFDRAECAKTGSKEDCKTKLVDCERANLLNFKEVMLSQSFNKA